ncbi:MAG: asparaginase domain-containing protein [Sphaerochaetaceae bacterium]
MAQELRIITTGGTFDKQYDAIKGELTFRESQLPKILNQSRCSLSVTLEGPLAVDSLFMTEEQRLEIANAIKTSAERKVIIVHGTDTMVKTASLVAKFLPPEDDHVIVFTGAMIPYSLDFSDAVFNLGCAVSAVQILPKGVYIAMSGRIFLWDNVVKNKVKGIFETLSDP